MTNTEIVLNIIKTLKNVRITKPVPSIVQLSVKNNVSHILFFIIYIYIYYSFSNCLLYF